jgi:hypothetical protein
MRRGGIAVALCSIVVGLAPQVAAEVRAIKNRDGAYEMTRVLTHDAKSSRSGVRTGTDMRGVVWSRMGRGAGPHTLNPEGDRRGDLWPTIADNSVAPHHPWAVWSRVNGTGYDLAWSRWTDAGWQPVDWVSSDGTGADDLDAHLDFDDEGRPCMVWWGKQGDQGTVYFSLFLQNRWMAPYRVSRTGVDARHPTVEAIDVKRFRVRYHTSAGTVEQSLLFDRPVTITDDINPLNRFFHGEFHLVEAAH